MVPAGEAAIGFICAICRGAGSHFPLIQDMLTYVYARGKGAGPAGDVGTVYWIRGVLAPCSPQRRCARPCANLATSR